MGLGDVLSLIAFLAAAVGASTIVEAFEGPGLVGHLMAGLFLGPAGFDVVPDSFLDGLSGLGQVGLMMLVFEGGMTMDMRLLRSSGGRAFTLALTGTVLPVMLGWGTMLLLGYGSMEAFASGTALSSTAIGFTLQLMRDVGLLCSRIGQIISAAAMIDDVLSLIVLAILQSAEDGVNVWYISRPVISSVAVVLVGGLLKQIVNTGFKRIFPADDECQIHTTEVSICRTAECAAIGPPAEHSVSQIENGGPSDGDSRRCECSVHDAESVKISETRDPKAMNVSSARGLEDRPEPREGMRAEGGGCVREGRDGDGGGRLLFAGAMRPLSNYRKYRRPVLLSFMTGSVCLLSWGADSLYSSSLLGTFAAGVVWSDLPLAHLLWEEHAVPYIPGLSMLFFSSTVAFVIPGDALFETSALTHGLVLTVAAILGKFFSGLWATHVHHPCFMGAAMTVGAAMIGRGELGFLLASDSLDSDLIGDVAFSSIVWALLLATVLGPFFFKLALSRFSLSEDLLEDLTSRGGKSGTSHPNASAHNHPSQEECLSPSGETLSSGTCGTNYAPTELEATTSRRYLPVLLTEPTQTSSLDGSNNGAKHPVHFGGKHGKARAEMELRSCSAPGYTQRYRETLSRCGAPLSIVGLDLSDVRGRGKLPKAPRRRRPNRQVWSDGSSGSSRSCSGSDSGLDSPNSSPRSKESCRTWG
eukprot:Rmarinus@m.18259